MVAVRISEITISDGDVITIPVEGVVLLVGPNNAGKSQTLKDLLGMARQGHNYQPRAVVHAGWVKSSEQDMTAWFTANLPNVVKDGATLVRVDGWGDVGAHDVAGQWNSPTLGLLTPVFVLHADGNSRLTAGNSQESLDFSVQLPTHPVHRAYQDPNLERQLDEVSRAAFGVGVVVDRYAGSVISLRLGSAPSFEHINGAPTLAYLERLKTLTRLEEQGDGVRSYLGLLLHMLAGTQQIMLVDEPEAFLHPPQARLLGRVLADRAKSQQAFIATHSADVVRGALESRSPVTIIRMTRVGDVNHASVLDHHALTKLWSDPLLRYSNLLDGLFHDAVILCEGDADCRYYAAVLDANLAAPSVDILSREPNFLFSHSGGKGRMSSVVSALRSVSVPVVVVADFDVLRDHADVERIVTSLGGNFEDVRDDLRLVGAALTSDVKPLRKETLKDAFLGAIAAIDGPVVSAKQAERLRAIARVENGWDRAKRSGLGAVPQGQPTEVCERLLAQLEVIGLLVVPVGELERFAPAVPGHGPGWVTEVLARGLHDNPGQPALDFVAKIRARVL